MAGYWLLSHELSAPLVSVKNLLLSNILPTLSGIHCPKQKGLIDGRSVHVVREKWEKCLLFVLLNFFKNWNGIWFLNNLKMIYVFYFIFHPQTSSPKMPRIKKLINTFLFIVNPLKKGYSTLISLSWETFMLSWRSTSFVLWYREVEPRAWSMLDKSTPPLSYILGPFIFRLSLAVTVWSLERSLKWQICALTSSLIHKM